MVVIIKIGLRKNVYKKWKDQIIFWQKFDEFIGENLILVLKKQTLLVL